MKKTTAIIRKGERTAQVAPGKTLSLSSNAMIDVEVTIKPYKPTRSASQNKLSWVWANALSEDSGETPAYHRAMFKLNHLAPIMARDDEDFAEVLEDFKAIMAGQETSNVCATCADGLISAGKCNTAQMAEAMSAWERDEAMKGNRLPHPDDYNFALQIQSYKETPEYQRAS